MPDRRSLVQEFAGEEVTGKSGQQDLLGDGLMMQGGGGVSLVSDVLVRHLPFVLSHCASR